MSVCVSGLVLAAGTSSRLGAPKQLLPWRGTTLLEWVVRQAENSPLDEVIVIVGHESSAVRHKVGFERARIVEAPDFHEGCSASIRAGLEEVSPNAEGAVLILGDQPGIKWPPWPPSLMDGAISNRRSFVFRIGASRGILYC